MPGQLADASRGGEGDDDHAAEAARVGDSRGRPGRCPVAAPADRDHRAGPFQPGQRVVHAARGAAHGPADLGPLPLPEPGSDACETPCAVSTPACMLARGRTRNAATHFPTRHGPTSQTPCRGLDAHCSPEHQMPREARDGMQAVVLRAGGGLGDTLV